MKTDTILHIFVGGLLTVFLSSLKIRGVFIFFAIFILAIGKEFLDHFLVVGHCYPICLDEHISDFLFSLMFFVLYFLIIAFTSEKSKDSNRYGHYLLIWLVVGLLHFVSQFYFNENIQITSEKTLLKVKTACR